VLFGDFRRHPESATAAAIGDDRGSMHRLALVAAAAAATLTMTGAAPPQDHARHHAEYYLSLGDSLAIGVQPDASGQSLPTDEGFTDQLYAMLSRHDPDLVVHKLGCGGETTVTMVNGGICGYDGGDLVSYSSDVGSQLDAATAFLAGHRGHVPLITIVIGANDVLNCLSLGAPDPIDACVQQELPIVKQELTAIMAKLTAADPRATIVGMTYADVALGAWVFGPGAQAFAIHSIAVDSAFRDVLAGVYHQAGARIADVFSAFETTDMTDQITLPGFGVVPEDVGLVCEWSWFCAPPPQGPNVHPNTTGYGVIARTFLAALRDRDRDR
jgi:lysophospholipase L1-like esterase